MIKRGAPPAGLVLLLSRMLAARAAEQGDCVNDTTYIYNTEMALRQAGQTGMEGSETRKYVLCPDTKYLIGDYDYGDKAFVGGGAALDLMLPNVHILCGEDGSSKNNCILEGGETQVFILPDETAEELFTNVVVRGLTFKGATDLNVVGVTARTDEEVGVLFQDCIFTENENNGLVESLEDYGNISDAMTLTFDSCVFDSNTKRNLGFYGNDSFALVNNGDQFMKITESVFRNNRVMIEDDPDERTFLVANEGEGILQVSSSYFENNTVSYALVFSEDPDLLISDDNHATDNIYTLEDACNGAATLKPVSPVEEPTPATFSTQLDGEILEFHCSPFPHPTSPSTPPPTPAPTPVSTEELTEGPTQGAAPPSSSSVLGFAGKHAILSAIVFMSLCLYQ